MKKPQKYRAHILVIRLSALGDVAILQPVLKARAESNSDVLFTIAAPPLLQPLFEGIDNVRFLGINKRQSIYRLFTQLKAVRPTLVADMHWVNRVIGVDMLFCLNGIKVRHIKKDRKARKALTRQHDKRTEPLKPSWKRYDEVFDACGLKPANPLLTQQSTNYWTATNTKADGQIRIGIAPFAQHVGKVWPYEHSQKLIEILASDKKNEILLFGSKEEAAKLEAWATAFENVRSVAGRQSFADELRIISSLNIMVSMDSANMHFASCMGVPVVSVWGATHPAGGFEGWRQDPRWSMQADMPCRPCSMYGKKPCLYGDYRCLHVIKPEVVADMVKNIIC